MQYKLFFAEKQYSFRSSSVPNSMILRFLFAIEWELHRVWLGVTRDLHGTCKGTTNPPYISKIAICMVDLLFLLRDP
jgi:hypothetical protein